MSNSNFVELIDYLKKKKILITTHNYVDIDGYVSSYVLKEFLTKFLDNKDVYIHYPEFSKQTLYFIEKLNKKYPDYQFLDEVDIDFSIIDVLLNFKYCCIGKVY